MNLLRRINVFWLGAGGFLALFCANELVAYHLSRTPKWLGGPMVEAANIVGLLLGLSVMAFLGIEEPREVSPDGSTSPGEGLREGLSEGQGEPGQAAET